MPMSSLVVTVQTAVQMSGTKDVPFLSPLSGGTPYSATYQPTFGSGTAEANQGVQHVALLAPGGTLTIDLRALANVVGEVVSGLTKAYFFLVEFLSAEAGYVPSATLTIGSGATNGFLGPSAIAWAETLRPGDSTGFVSRAGATVSATVKTLDLSVANTAATDGARFRITLIGLD